MDYGRREARVYSTAPPYISDHVLKLERYAPCLRGKPLGCVAAVGLLPSGPIKLMERCLVLGREEIGGSC